MATYTDGGQRVVAAALTNRQKPEAWIAATELSDEPFEIDDGLVSFSTLTALHAIEGNRLAADLLRPLVSGDKGGPPPPWLDLTKTANLDSIVIAVGGGRAAYPVYVGAHRMRACALLVDFLAPLPDIAA